MKQTKIHAIIGTGDSADDLRLHKAYGEHGSSYEDRVWAAECHGDASVSFAESVAQWPMVSYDAFVAIDSLYAIHPLDLMNWCLSSGTMGGYGTMHTIAELNDPNVIWPVVNPVFSTKWEVQKKGFYSNSLTKNQVLMRHMFCPSLNYIMDRGIMSIWAKGIVSDGVRSMIWEPVRGGAGYYYMHFVVVSKPIEIDHRFYWNSFNMVVMIPDLERLLNYGELVYTPCLYEKYQKTFHYAMSQKNPEQLYEKINQHVRNEMNQIVVNGVTITPQWERLDQRNAIGEFLTIVETCAYHVSLRKLRSRRLQKGVGAVISGVHHMLTIWGRQVTWRFARITRNFRRALGIREEPLTHLERILSREDKYFSAAVGSPWGPQQRDELTYNYFEEFYEVLDQYDREIDLSQEYLSEIGFSETDKGGVSSGLGAYCKLQDLKLKSASVSVFGVEPGAMVKELAMQNKAVHAYVVHGSAHEQREDGSHMYTPSPDLLKLKSVTWKMQRTYALPASRLPKITGAAIFDMAVSSDPRDRINELILRDIMQYLVRNRHREVVIKQLHWDESFCAHLWTLGYNLEPLFRRSNINPISMEYYLVGRQEASVKRAWKTFDGFKVAVLSGSQEIMAERMKYRYWASFKGEKPVAQLVNGAFVTGPFQPAPFPLAPPTNFNLRQLELPELPLRVTMPETGDPPVVTGVMSVDRWLPLRLNSLRDDTDIELDAFYVPPRSINRARVRPIEMEEIPVEADEMIPILHENDMANASAPADVLDGLEAAVLHIAAASAPPVEADELAAPEEWIIARAQMPQASVQVAPVVEVMQSVTGPLSFEEQRLVDTRLQADLALARKLADEALIKLPELVPVPAPQSQPTAVPVPTPTADATNVKVWVTNNPFLPEGIQVIDGESIRVQRRVAMPKEEALAVLRGARKGSVTPAAPTLTPPAVATSGVPVVLSAPDNLPEGLQIVDGKRVNVVHPSDAHIVGTPIVRREEVPLIEKIRDVPKSDLGPGIGEVPWNYFKYTRGSTPDTSVFEFPKPPWYKMWEQVRKVHFKDHILGDVDGEGKCVYHVMSIHLFQVPDEWEKARKLFSDWLLATGGDVEEARKPMGPSQNVAVGFLSSVMNVYEVDSLTWNVTVTRTAAVPSLVSALIYQNHAYAVVASGHPTYAAAVESDMHKSLDRVRAKKGPLGKYGHDVHFSAAENEKAKADMLVALKETFVPDHQGGHARAAQAIEKIAVGPSTARFFMYVAAAGTGKTDWSARYHNPSTDLVSAPTNDMREECEKKILQYHPGYYMKKVITKTMFMLFAEDKKRGLTFPCNWKKLIFVEEALRLPSFYFQVLSLMFPEAIFVCLTDYRQPQVNDKWFPNFRPANGIHLALLDLLKKRGVKSADELTPEERGQEMTLPELMQSHANSVVTRRFGANCIKLIRSTLAQSMYQELRTCNFKCFKINVAKYGTSVNLKEPNVLGVHFNSKDAEDYREVYSSQLTHVASQGLTVKHTYIFCTSSPEGLISKQPEGIYVALSRATDEDTFVEAERNALDGHNWGTYPLFQPSIGSQSYNLDLWRREDVRTHFTGAHEARLEALGLDPDLVRDRANPTPIRDDFSEIKHAKVTKWPAFTTRDSFVWEDLRSVIPLIPSPGLQQQALLFNAKRGVNWKVNLAEFMPIEKELEVMDGSAYGKRHFTASAIQTANTMMHRMGLNRLALANQKSKAETVKLGQKRVREEFFDVFIDKDRWEECMNSEAKAQMSTAAYNEMINVAKFSLEDVEKYDHYTLRQVNTHLKGQMKPKPLEGTLGEKEGQPINAEEKRLNLLLGHTIRESMKVLKKSLKSKWKVTDGMTEEEKSEWLRQFEIIDCFEDEWELKVLWRIMCDAPSFDSVHTLFATADFEFTVYCLAMEWPELLRDYHKHREWAIAVHKAFTMVIAQIKHSGGSDTYWGNTVVMMCILLLVLELKKARCGMFGGDDSNLLSTEKLTVNRMFADAIFLAPLKVNYHPYVSEFCSHLIKGGLSIYNPEQLARKIVNKTFRQVLSREKDWVEYTDALSMVFNSVRKDPEAAARICALWFGWHPETAFARLQILDSFINMSYGYAKKVLRTEELVVTDYVGGHSEEGVIFNATLPLEDIATKSIYNTTISQMYKSKLNEYTQRQRIDGPSYNVTKTGPEHCPTFKATVRVAGFNAIGGSAGSLSDAENLAAKAAFEALQTRSQTVQIQQPAPSSAASNPEVLSVAADLGRLYNSQKDVLDRLENVENLWDSKLKNSVSTFGEVAAAVQRGLQPTMERLSRMEQLIEVLGARVGAAEANIVDQKLVTERLEALTSELVMKIDLLSFMSEVTGVNDAIEVYVRDHVNKTQRMVITPALDGDALTRMVASLIHLPIECFWLQFRGKPISSQDTVRSLGILRDDTLVVQTRLPGGYSRDEPTIPASEGLGDNQMPSLVSDMPTYETRIVFIRTLNGNTLLRNFSVTDNLFDIKDFISFLTHVPEDAFFLTCGGHLLDPVDSMLNVDDYSTIVMNPRLPGGIQPGPARKGRPAKTEKKAERKVYREVRKTEKAVGKMEQAVSAAKKTNALGSRAHRVAGSANQFRRMPKRVTKAAKKAHMRNLSRDDRLALGVCMPGYVPAERYSSATGIVSSKTAKNSLLWISDATVSTIADSIGSAQKNETCAIVFQNPVCNSVVYKETASAEVAASIYMKTAESSSVGPVASSAKFHLTDQFQNVPAKFVKYNSGDYECTFSKDQNLNNDDDGILYVNHPNNTLSLIVQLPASGSVDVDECVYNTADLFYEVWMRHDGSETRVANGQSLGNGTTTAVTLNFQPDLTANALLVKGQKLILIVKIKAVCKSAVPDIVPTDLNVTLTFTRKYGAGNTQAPYYQAYMIKDLDLHMNQTEQMRVQGHGFMLSNRNNALTRGGSVVGSRYGPEASWVAPNFTFKTVASAKDKATWGAEKGMHGWVPPADTEWWFYQGGWQWDDTFGIVKITAPQYPKQGFIVIVAQLQDTTTSYTDAIIYEDGICGEYLTEDLWADIDQPELSPHNSERVLARLRSVPIFHENPSHIASIFSELAGMAEKGVNFISKALPVIKGVSSMLA